MKPEELEQLKKLLQKAVDTLDRAEKWPKIASRLEACWSYLNEKSIADTIRNAQ